MEGRRAPSLDGLVLADAGQKIKEGPGFPKSVKAGKVARSVLERGLGLRSQRACDLELLSPLDPICAPDLHAAQMLPSVHEPLMTGVGSSGPGLKALEFLWAQEARRVVWPQTVESLLPRGAKFGGPGPDGQILPGIREEFKDRCALLRRGMEEPIKLPLGQKHGALEFLDAKAFEDLAEDPATLPLGGVFIEDVPSSATCIATRIATFAATHAAACASCDHPRRERMLGSLHFAPGGASGPLGLPRGPKAQATRRESQNLPLAQPQRLPQRLPQPQRPARGGVAAEDDFCKALAGVS